MEGYTACQTLLKMAKAYEINYQTDKHEEGDEETCKR